MQSSRVACQKQLLHSNFRPVPKSLFLAERSSRCCRLYMKKESKSSLGYLGCCESSSLHWLHWFWYLDIPNKSGLWMIIPLCFLVDSMSPSSKSLYISLKTTTDIDLPVLARVEGDANIQIPFPPAFMKACGLSTSDLFGLRPYWPNVPIWPWSISRKDLSNSSLAPPSVWHDCPKRFCFRGWLWVWDPKAWNQSFIYGFHGIENIPFPPAFMKASAAVSALQTFLV